MGEYTLSVDVKTDRDVHEVVLLLRDVSMLVGMEPGIEVQGVNLTRYEDDNDDDHAITFRPLVAVAVDVDSNGDDTDDSGAR